MLDLNSVLGSIMGNKNGEDLMETIGNEVGVDKEKINSAMEVGVPLLMEALNRNTNDESGADSLAKALEKDHDGSILNNIPDFVKNYDKGPGEGILNHVFGSKEKEVEKAISKSSGLDLSQASNLLKIISPIVLGGLGKQKKEQNLDASGLSQLTSVLSSTILKNTGGSSPVGGLVNMLLDKDKDGSITDDLLNMAMGSLFKKNK